MGRIFAIGDIHGCYEKLVDLMAQLPIDWAHDRLVFIGDYIDRGHEPFAVVEYLAGLKARQPGIVFLKGNHEDMLLNYLDGQDRLTYLYNGGQQTLDSYLRASGGPGAYPIPGHHLSFYRSLRLHFETEDYIFVHAGLRAGIPLAQQDPQDLLWIREKFIDHRESFGKRVVFGHTPFDKPRVEANKIGIDTGAVYGNLLTGLQLPELRFFFA
jgi:serine/threonine protein phosphatase 1